MDYRDKCKAEDCENCICCECEHDPESCLAKRYCKLFGVDIETVERRDNMEHFEMEHDSQLKLALDLLEVLELADE